jgi:hypothetical protein
MDWRLKMNEEEIKHTLEDCRDLIDSDSKVIFTFKENVGEDGVFQVNLEGRVLFGKDENFEALTPAAQFAYVTFKLFRDNQSEYMAYVGNAWQAFKKENEKYLSKPEEKLE